MSLLPGLMLNSLMVACIFPTGIAQDAKLIPGKQREKIVQTEGKVVTLFEDCQKEIPIFTNLIVAEMIQFSIIKQ